MAREETSGGSCGTPSGAGRGPLYNARRSVRDSVTTLRDGMTRSWLEPVQADVEQLKQSGGRARRRDRRGAAAQLRGQGVRHPRPGAQHRRAQQPARQVDRRRDARASPARWPSRRARPASPATTRRWPSGCAQAAAQAEQPAELKLREAVFNEGPAGVANAVKNLWRNIGAYASSLVGLRVLGRQAGGRPHRQRRADHRTRPDRAARHHRHRSGPAGAGDPQSAARAAVDPSIGRAQPADQRRDRHRDRPRRASTANGCTGISSITTRRRISSSPTSTAADPNEQGGIGKGAGHEPARRRAERSWTGALAHNASDGSRRASSKS